MWHNSTDDILFIAVTTWTDSVGESTRPDDLGESSGTDDIREFVEQQRVSRRTVETATSPTFDGIGFAGEGRDQLRGVDQGQGQAVESGLGNDATRRPRRFGSRTGERMISFDSRVVLKWRHALKEMSTVAKQVCRGPNSLKVSHLWVDLKNNSTTQNLSFCRLLILHTLFKFFT